MVESTFVSTAKKRFAFKHEFKQPSGEFHNIGYNVFESEDLINALYDIFLNLITQGWFTDLKGMGNIKHIANAYTYGFYVCCDERVVLRGQVDLLNDTLPDYAGVVLYEENRPIFCVTIKESPPTSIVCFPGFQSFSVTNLYQKRDDDISNRKDRKLNNCMRFFTRYVGISETTGEVKTLIHKHLEQDFIPFAALSREACITINSWIDKKYLWLVKTDENITNIDRTPLTLGVNPSHIKSLFYARHLPVTESGRKRPILHWVRSHQRRIQSGIDIDISKHLRGIFKFEMEGFNFEITQPQKLIKA